MYKYSDWHIGLVKSNWCSSIFASRNPRELAEAMMSGKGKRVAFTGFGNSGKDTAAQVLIELGFQRVAFGDEIKRRSMDCSIVSQKTLANWMNYEINDYRLGKTDDETCRLLHEAHQADMRIVEKASFGIYRIQSGLANPFTEVDSEKDALRPALEWLGMMQYEAILKKFNDNLPEIAVNTRLMRIKEAREWKAQGGIILNIEREGAVAETDFARKSFVEINSQIGLIDCTIYNNGSKEELWEEVLNTVVSRS